eukprot:TRINITY_DN14172_c0_g3_i1.p1 TRINITY_DN14172_c0_g3~~TRINITY_DN14172_c0_g3_i1.p1  ORF type:complete len:650 (+),score=78.42 TRINITY_DN14172_c0_g3_i1:65-2014(+)
MIFSRRCPAEFVTACLWLPAAQWSHFGDGPAPVLFPALTAKILAPFDKLVESVSVATSWVHDSFSSTDRVAAEEDGLPLPGSEVETTKRLSRVKFHMQVLFLMMSIVMLSVCYYFHQFAATSEYGEPLTMTCHEYMSKFTTSPFSSKCGLNAELCPPSEHWNAVRCDGWCSQRQWDSIRYPVIGSGPYRADSRICLAGQHAGAFPADRGGCMLFRVVGAASSFNGSTRNGITSLSFDSWFPVALEVRAASGAYHCGYGEWWLLLVLNVVLLAVFSCLRPSRSLYFACLNVALYWYCALGASMSHEHTNALMSHIGGFIYYVPFAFFFFWHLGDAKTHFPDPAEGAFFDVLLLEIIPALPLLHMHLLSFVVGDYGLSASTLQSLYGMLLYGISILLLLPVVAYLLLQWKRAGALRLFLRRVFLGLVAISLISLLFATRGYGLHLHHYFIALLGYLGSRGNSIVARGVRAFCLGAVITGLVFWVGLHHMSLWEYGPGWFPSPGRIETGASGLLDRPVWTNVRWLAPSDTVELSWALETDLSTSCEDPSEAERARRAATGAVFIVEMNHITVYQGQARAGNFTLPAGARPSYFRVGTLRRSLLSGYESSSMVLAVRAAEPPVYAAGFNASGDACIRARALMQQPRDALVGFV